MRAVYSTAPLRALSLLAVCGLATCAPAHFPPGHPMTTPSPAVPSQAASSQGASSQAEPSQTGDHFIMADGTRLPYRAWLPDREEPPWAVILALHGMNDSQDAWEYAAPAFTDAGIALFAPDQRGFGHTAQRGVWPGGQALADDASAMARLLRARFPGAKLILMGESMGAAALLVAATGPTPPPADGYVLLAPAVWGRGQMNVFIRSSLWFASTVFP